MKKIVVFLFIIATHHYVFSQSGEALTFSFIKESSKLPSQRAFGKPFHPGFEMGYENQLNQNERHQLSFAVKIGYYYHKDFHHGVTVKPCINYYYVTNSNYYFGSELNMGYLHAFMDKTIYKQNSSGNYEKITNWGKPKFMPSIALSSGYQLSQTSSVPLDFFIKYELAIETPFSRGIDIPVFPHSFIHIGTKWYAFN